MENQSVKRGFWHKLFGTTPNDGNLQPREAIAYSITGIGQNFICTIIGSYLTIFMTDALLMADDGRQYYDGNGNHVYYDRRLIARPEKEKEEELQENNH